MYYTHNKLFNIYLVFLFLILVSCNETGLDSSIDDYILSTQDNKIVDASNDFGFDIIRLSQQNKSNENIIFSSFELSTSLNLLLNGASGSKFNFINYYINPANYTIDEVNNSYKKIIDAVNRYSPELIFLNSLWYQNGIGVNNHFKNIGTFFYGFYIDSLYFEDEDELETISDWIHSKSNNEFSFNYENDESNINSLLIQTFSLNMPWRKKFDTTKEAKFKITNSDSVTVDMLNVKGFYNYFSNELFEIIQIPYSNENLSFLAFRIKENVAIREVILRLNSSTWNYWINQLSKTAVNLSIPKLNLSKEHDINAYIKNSILSFIIDNENGYSNISSSEFSIDQFYTISSLYIHAEGDVSALNPNNLDNYNSSKVVQICFDSPFLFAIKEDNSNLILLSGIIRNPNQEN